MIVHDYVSIQPAKRGRRKASSAEVVVVYNPNPFPVVVTESGQSVGGYEKAKIRAEDIVAKRAISAGLVLVPSE